MLCSVYAICKVMEREIKFKSIIKTYAELPFASPSVRFVCTYHTHQITFGIVLQMNVYKILMHIRFVTDCCGTFYGFEQPNIFP